MHLSYGPDFCITRMLVMLSLAACNPLFSVVGKYWKTRTVILNELVLNRELENILEQLVVLRKADWTWVFGGLKLRPLEPWESFHHSICLLLASPPASSASLIVPGHLVTCAAARCIPWNEGTEWKTNRASARGWLESWVDATKNTAKFRAKLHHSH